MGAHSKPPVSGVIMDGHPLAQGLVACFVLNEGGGVVHDLVSGAVMPMNASGAFGTANFGAGLDCSAAADSGAFTDVWDKLREVKKAFTVLWRGTIKASPDGFAALLNVTFTNADTAPFLAYGLQLNNGGNGYFLGWNDGGSGTSFQVNAATAFDGTERQIVGAVRGDGGANLLYESPNPVPIASGNTQNSSPNFGTTPKIGIGVYQASRGRNSKSVCRHAYIWRRQLSASEVAQLWVEPYAFIRQSRQRSYGTPIAASIVANPMGGLSPLLGYVL